MDKEKQRIKIAEVCGWKDIFVENNRTLLGKHEPESMGRDYLDVPDYLNDLNAMHEAEKKMTLQQVSDFGKRLERIVIPFHASANVSGQIWHATAAQRAEAFLRTLNLWEE